MSGVFIFMSFFFFFSAVPCVRRRRGVLHVSTSLFFVLKRKTGTFLLIPPPMLSLCVFFFSSIAAEVLAGRTFLEKKIKQNVIFLFTPDTPLSSLSFATVYFFFCPLCFPIPEYFVARCATHFFLSIIVLQIRLAFKKSCQNSPQKKIPKSAKFIWTPSFLECSELTPRVFSLMSPAQYSLHCNTDCSIFFFFDDMGMCLKSMMGFLLSGIFSFCCLCVLPC